MSWTGTTMVAASGLYAYASLYYGLVYRSRRPQVIYRAFAGFAGCLGLFSFGGGMAILSPDPAHAVPYQTLQFIAFLGFLAFLLDFIGELTEWREPRVVRASYAFAGLGATAALAGLFFDPAVTLPVYRWERSSSIALADLSMLGRVFLLTGLGVSTYAVGRLVVSARSRRELIPAAVASVVAILAGAVDAAIIVLEAAPVHLAAHVVVIPVFAFSYVLVGRLTEVDSQLAVLTGELRKSYDHLRQTQEEIVKKEQLAAVGELSAVIAHEVRNPLAIIKNSVSGLRRSEIQPDDAQTLLHILDAETDRLNRLVNDLLAYARPIATESGMPVDLRRLVAHAVELAAAGNPAIARVEVELSLDNEVAAVEGDEALLRHALINIVDNALQAMPDGGTLTVSCRDTNVDGRPSVAVDFHDTGEGMDTLVRSRARDPFFTTRQSGTGLGLAIVERVARAHGGRVEIESRHGAGTTVSLVVPCERGSLVPGGS